ncbi:uncharacterized protein VICG_01117 [Vittaforma corneae ATCC 50505]|uniref:Uncharacterized protein n=1 Tax=Vittaforma corneae (strain ATCC 50505) TaxID=993615 RepID=L2GMP1_VITCO|nr:uncharacterized protein VICG_01117 [Vittaforma corneae ATCC 50505]ELA41765.1 hypothetical protein VICG_01117 [Vittaforma corneae ATCC 50505]
MNAIKTMKCMCLIFILFLFISNCIYLTDINGNFISFDQERNILYATKSNSSPLSFHFVRKKDPSHINIRKWILWIDKDKTLTLGRDNDKVILKKISKNESPDLFEIMKSTNNKATIKFRNKDKCIVSQNGLIIKMGSCKHSNSQFYKVKEIEQPDKGKDTDQGKVKYIEEVLMEFGNEIARALPELVEEEVTIQNNTLKNNLINTNETEKPLKAENEKKKLKKELHPQKSQSDNAEPGNKDIEYVKISKTEAQKLLEIVNSLAQLEQQKRTVPNPQISAQPSNSDLSTFPRVDSKNDKTSPLSPMGNIATHPTLTNPTNGSSNYSSMPSNLFKAQNGLQPSNITNNMGSPWMHDNTGIHPSQPNPNMTQFPYPPAGQPIPHYASTNPPTEYYTKNINKERMNLDIIQLLIDSKDPTLRKLGLQLAIDSLTKSDSGTASLNSELATKILLLLKSNENNKENEEKSKKDTEVALLEYRLGQLETNRQIQQNDKINEAKKNKKARKKEWRWWFVWQSF